MKDPIKKQRGIEVLNHETGQIGVAYYEDQKANPKPEVLLVNVEGEKKQWPREKCKTLGFID